MDAHDLHDLLDSWLLRLRAERKSPQTIAAYRAGVLGYLDYCKREHIAAVLTPDSLAAYVGALLDAGRTPGTARLRHIAVRLFSAWLAAEGETDRDALIMSKGPKLDERPVDSLADDQLAALLKACTGTAFADRRDEAIVRLMVETGLRAGEVVGMAIGDVDLAHGVATIRKAKGGKTRTVAFGPVTGAAIDRYIRARRRHPGAHVSSLWLAARGHTGGLSYSGLHRALSSRAAAAGIAHFHPHRLRHSFASRWLAAGGSEQGLMVSAGWSRRDMLDRYSRDTSARRAHEEARRLDLGNI